MGPTQILVALCTLQVITLVVLLIAIFRMRKAYWEVLSTVELQKQHIERVAIDVVNEVQNSVALTSLGLPFPVFFGEWAMDSVLARFLIQHLIEERPSTIVELGSGTSTVVIARCRELLGLRSGLHVAVDHEERYLSLTRRLAELNGVADGIEFVRCPLSLEPGASAPWYGGLAEVLSSRLGGVRIDLLLVDGPPGSAGVRSRYPALPMLNGLLSDRCVVILDDAVRKEEREIAEAWVKEFPGFKLEILHYAHRAAILRRVSHD